MALIKCPDCGKIFSEYAERCPDCGCPTKDAKAANIANDSPFSQPTEGGESNEQAPSLIDEKGVEGETVSQENVQPSTENDESNIEAQKTIRKWLWCVGIMAVLLVGFIIAYNSFDPQKDDDRTSQEVIAQIESQKGIEGNAFTELRTYYLGVEVEDDEDQPYSVTITFTPQNEVWIKYEVQDIEEWAGEYTINGQTVTMNVWNVYNSARNEVVTAMLKDNELILDKNDVCVPVALERSDVSGIKDKERQLLERSRYIVTDFEKKGFTSFVDDGIFSPSFHEILMKSYQLEQNMTGEDLSFEELYYWLQGNEVDPDGKIVGISVSIIENDKAELKVVYKNYKPQLHIMKLVRVNEQWYCDNWDSKKEDLLRDIEQVENNSTSDLDTEQRMELIRNHEWGDNMLHHHLVGTMSDETGKHPIELDFDYCNVESGTIENAIYKNVELGGRIKMNGEVSRGGLLNFSGKDGNQNFTIRIDPSDLEGESFIGEKHLTVSLMPQCNHSLAQ